MTVETATLIHELNPLLPDQDDGLTEGDNHIRLLKAALQATFPNINAAVTASDEDLNNIRTATDSLDALAALTPASNKLPYFTAAATAALADLSVFGRTLIDDADAATARSTLGLGSLATQSVVNTANIADDNVTFDKVQNISTARLLGRTTASSGNIEQISVGTGLSLSAGSLSYSGLRVLQRLAQVSATQQALASHVIPDDDTTPLSTEGALAFSQAITPQSATSKIRISGVLSVGCSTQSIGSVAALFEGTTCIAVFPADNISNANDQIAFDYEETSGSTAARTYSIRYGSAVGNIGLNVDGGGAGDYGNKITSSMIVEEYTT